MGYVFVWGCVRAGYPTLTQAHMQRHEFIGLGGKKAGRKMCLADGVHMCVRFLLVVVGVALQSLSVVTDRINPVNQPHNACDGVSSGMRTVVCCAVLSVAAVV